MTSKKRFVTFAAVFGTLAGALILFSVSIIEGPAIMQLRKLDDRRVRDLQQIAGELETRFQKLRTLASDLDVLSKNSGAKLSLHDPETGVPYRYEMRTVNSYRLCAVFSLQDDTIDPYFYAPKINWRHKAGEHCYDVEVQLKEPISSLR